MAVKGSATWQPSGGGEAGAGRARCGAGGSVRSGRNWGRRRWSGWRATGARGGASGVGRVKVGEGWRGGARWWRRGVGGGRGGVVPVGDAAARAALGMGALAKAPDLLMLGSMALGQMQAAAALALAAGIELEAGA